MLTHTHTHTHTHTLLFPLVHRISRALFLSIHFTVEENITETWWNEWTHRSHRTAPYLRRLCSLQSNEGPKVCVQKSVPVGK